MNESNQNSNYTQKNPNLFNDEYHERFTRKKECYFDKIPAFIDYLTYIDCEIDKKTGEETWYRKRLTPHQKELYRVIKQKAGKENKAWATGQTYADQIGCSNKTVVKGKIALMQAFEQLDGLSLILIDERRTRTKSADGSKYINSKVMHYISTVNITPYNNAFSKIKPDRFLPMRQKITKEEAEQAIERMRQGSLSDNKAEIVHNYGRSVVGISASEAECSCAKSSQGQENRRSVVVPPKHTPLPTYSNVYITDSSSKAAPFVFLHKNLSECFQDEYSAEEWLLDIGVDRKFVKSFDIPNNLGSLYQAAEYCREMQKRKQKKGEVIGKLAAYFIDSYQNKRYNNLRK